MVLALIAGETRTRPQVEEKQPVLLTLAMGGGGSPTVVQAPDKPPVPPPPPPTAVSTPSSTPPAVALDATPPAALAPASATADVGPAGGCAMVERLQARLGGDEDALSALRQIPTQARSVANAVQLWDGTWTALKAADGRDLLAPIQGVVAQTIRTATPTCQAEQVLGPRLILIDQGADTLALSLGSGAWRWSDLLEQGPPPA